MMKDSFFHLISIRAGHEKVRQDLEKYCQTLESERNDLESELTRVNVTLKNSNEVSCSVMFKNYFCNFFSLSVDIKITQQYLKMIPY